MASPAGAGLAAAGPGRRKVLFLSGLQVHPTLSGGNLRSYALANALGRHGFDVFVYSLVGRKPDYLARRASAIQEWPGGVAEHVDRGLFGFVAQFGSYRLGLPPFWLTAYLRAAGASPGEVLLPRLLRERLAWCDVVVADFPFVHSIFRARSARGRVRVLSTHNLEHQMHDGRTRWSRFLATAVRRLELSAVRASDVLVSCCEGDQRFFEDHGGPRRSVLVPNGIDLRRFRGLEAQRAATRQALSVADDVMLCLFTASKYGPNQEAFEYLLGFARSHAGLLAQRKIHVLVVGNVAREPIHLPGFTATGKVDVVEPYFAAADAALNPMASGAGTNVKMCEFIATRLPIVSTPFGARGFRLEDGRTGFLFEKEALAPVLSVVRRLFDEDPERLRRIAEDAYAENESAIDMDVCVRALVDAVDDAGAAPPA